MSADYGERTNVVILTRKLVGADVRWTLTMLYHCRSRRVCYCGTVERTDSVLPCRTLRAALVATYAMVLAKRTVIRKFAYSQRIIDSGGVDISPRLRVSTYFCTQISRIKCQV